MAITWPYQKTVLLANTSSCNDGGTGSVSQLLTPAMSAAVTMPSTPGIASALEASIESMSAYACVDVT